MLYLLSAHPPSCTSLSTQNVSCSHLLTCSRQIPRRFDHPLPAIVMLIKFLPESLKHWHIRRGGGVFAVRHLGVCALGTHLLITGSDRVRTITYDQDVKKPLFAFRLPFCGLLGSRCAGYASPLPERRQLSRCLADKLASIRIQCAARLLCQTKAPLSIPLCHHSWRFRV